MKRVMIGLATVLILLLAIACSSEEEAAAPAASESEAKQEQAAATKVVKVEEATATKVPPTVDPESKKYGGDLRIASQGSISTLDPVFTQFATNNAVAQNFYDRMFGWDRDYNPSPQMVESWDISSSNRTYTFTLRSGLKFHDGSDVEAADVAASLERWLPSTFPYATMMKNFAATPWTSVISKTTLTINLDDPYTFVLQSIAPPHKAPMVFPAENAATPHTEAVPNWIGSGPYKFSEWKQGDRVILVRAETYTARTDANSGYAGSQEPYLDTLTWLEIPDQETKMAGLETGEWDVVEGAGLDFWPRVIENDDLAVGLRRPGNRNNIMLNPWNWPFGNAEDDPNIDSGTRFNPTAKTMRQAVMYGVDIEAVMQALGPKELWTLCPNYYYCGTPLGDDTDVGPEYYNINDKDLAKKMLAEAGYNGETIIVMTPNDYATITPIGQFMKQEMEDMGFTVDQPNRDWATVVTVFTTQDGWDANASWSGWGVTSDPINDEQAAGQTAFWPTIPKIQELRLAWTKEDDPAKKRAIRMEIETMLYEEVVVIGLGIHYQIVPYTAKLKNLSTASTIVYSGTWLE